MSVIYFEGYTPKFYPMFRLQNGITSIGLQRAYRGIMSYIGIKYLDSQDLVKNVVGHKSVCSWRVHVMAM